MGRIWTLEQRAAMMRRKRDTSKLTADDILAIRAAAENGETQRSLAARYRVNASMISAIVERRLWTHVRSTPIPLFGPVAYSAVRILDPADETRVLREISVDELRARGPVVPDAAMPSIEPAALVSFALVSPARRKKAPLTMEERSQALARTKRADAAREMRIIAMEESA